MIKIPDYVQSQYEALQQEIEDIQQKQSLLLQGFLSGQDIEGKADIDLQEGVIREAEEGE